MKTLGKMAAALLLSLLSSMATAAITESLLTASLSAPREAGGGLMEFDLKIRTDAIPLSLTILGDPLWSGGVTLTYDDDVLKYVDFKFDVGLSGTQGIPQEGCGLVLQGCISGVTFDSHLTPGVPYQTQDVANGGVKIGTYIFQYKGGASDLILGKDPSAPFLNGSEAALPGLAITQFATVNATVVPLPLAAWLMLSGLGMLGVFGFRKSD